MKLNNIFSTIFALALWATVAQGQTLKMNGMNGEPYIVPAADTVSSVSDTYHQNGYAASASIDGYVTTFYHANWSGG